MKVITTREIRSETKLYFELAEKERVVVKRGKKFVNLIVSDEPDRIFLDENWVKGFMEIPAEYRINPFEISPSGDLYYADRRNVERLKEAISDPEQRKVVKTVKNKAELQTFLESL
ncbi:hypothetical protein [Parapedobacter koreensis]|uniref:Uncharacterized protein n=1 Tax=Parapedobacter koreensis TaxID=332977 RepID=A0A1H7LJA7_9SPHI|nr:hypothetical protein [Parapedobacter koreensis]SEK99062.1 hypothetical protein SAMN05421740_103185 [Parapedobacter koreensis]